LDRLIKRGVLRKASPNARYESVDVLRVLFYTAMMQTFVESAAMQLRYIWGCVVPDADTVFRRLMQSGEDSLKALLVFNRELVKTARSEGWLRKKVVVAIDMWDREYYGKNRDVNCSTGKEKNGTRYFHRVATLAIVEKGKRLEVAMVPVSLFARKERIVRTLLAETMEFASIRAVLLDRGFNSASVIHTIESLGLKYVMPATRNKRIKHEIAKASGLWFQVVKRYRFRLDACVETTLIILDTELYGRKTHDPYLTYITNLCVSNVKESVLTVAHLYEARWGIETGYRVKKWEFRAKTCSESSVVRFFFILLAIILYNIWTLLRFSELTCFKNGIPAGIFSGAYTQFVRTNSA
jgi:IS4 transposase